MQAVLEMEEKVYGARRIGEEKIRKGSESWSEEIMMVVKRKSVSGYGEGLVGLWENEKGS